MKSVKWLLPIVLVIGAVGFGCNAPKDAGLGAPQAQPVTASLPAEQAEREVREAHEAYYRTLVEEGSDAALVRYYGDDFTYIGVDGKIVDKEGLRVRMQRNELQHFELEDDLRRVSVYGDVAVLSGHSTTKAKDKGEEHAATEGYTEVWVRRDGRWELVAEQLTPQD